MFETYDIDEDQNVLEQFVDDFEDLISDAERILIQLEQTGADDQAFAQVKSKTQQLYSVALNSNIMPFLEPLCVIDEFATKIKSLDFHPRAVTVLAQVLDLFLVASRDVRNGAIRFDLMSEIQDAVVPLARIRNQDDLAARIEQTAKIISGEEEDSQGDDLDVVFFESPPEVESSKSDDSSKGDNSSKSVELGDTWQTVLCLALSEFLEERVTAWRNRSKTLISLAMQMNRFRDDVVSESDLTKAILLHDFPLISHPDPVLGHLAAADNVHGLVLEHPSKAYNLAKLIGVGPTCADIILQHHEQFSGAGYPNGLKGSEIHPGASIIAICDAYYDTLVDEDVSQGRSELRAVAEINAGSGLRFDPEWVEVFNEIVRVDRSLRKDGEEVIWKL